MGNWIYCDITIGGKASAATGKELRALLKAQFDGDGPETTNSCLFASGQRNYGNADEVEDFCIEHGLPYVLTWEDGGDFGPGGNAWRPGKQGPLAFEGKNSPCVSLADLQRDAEAGKTLADIIEALSIADASTLPPYIEEAGEETTDAGPAEEPPAPLTDFLCIGTYVDGQRFAETVGAKDADEAEGVASQKWPSVDWAGFVALRNGVMTVEG